MDDTTTLDSITLTQFLETLYPADDRNGELVLLATPSPKGFAQYRATTRKINSIAGRPGEWYVCVSTVAEQTPIRRRKSDCKTVWVLMLDDIGTKAQAPPIAPSCILETSANNYQYLYFLHPVDIGTPSQVEHFEACNRALIAAGYCDEGAGGVSRVFRIPGSINMKEGRNRWPTRITYWAPETVYDLDELMAELKLKPQEKTSQALDVPVPAGIVDPVAVWLADRNLLGELVEFGHQVRCPWTHEHSDGNMDAKAGYSPLGHGMLPLYRIFHCFHAHCAHRGGNEFLAWVAEQGGPSVDVTGVREIAADQVKAMATSLSSEERVQLLRDSLPAVRRANLVDIEYSAGGTIIKAQPVTAANVERVAQLLGVRIRRNMQSHTVECSYIDPAMNALVESVHDETLMTLMDSCEVVGMKGGKNIGDRVNIASGRHKFSPVVEWVRSQPWDGVSRFDDLAATVTCQPGHEDAFSIYLRRWLIEAMQAMHNWQGDPKAIEYVLVLNGEQGCGKTSWLRSLVPPTFFSEGKYLNLGKGVTSDRDAVRLVTATPIVELGELETTFTKSEVGHQKNFLSQTVDTYRMAYGTIEVSFPRTTAYAGTVNQQDFLVDGTGSRRYWCVRVLACDFMHEVDMQQLWAEVYLWWQSGEQFHLTAAEEQMRVAMASQFEYVTPVAELVQQYFATHSDATVEYMTCTTFMKDRLNLTINNANKAACKVALEVTSRVTSRRHHGIRNAYEIPMTYMVANASGLKLVKDDD